MLHLLTIRQVAENLEFLVPQIDSSLPDKWLQDGKKIEAVYKSLASGLLRVWVYKEPEKDIKAVLSTTYHVDPITGSSSLLIYTIKGLERITDEDWKDGFAILKEYAKTHGLGYVNGFTNNKHIVEVVKRLGGDFNFSVFLEVA